MEDSAMGAPIYLQIHNELKRQIEQGKYKIGDKIPAERDLALEFEVSRMTLRQAVQTLAEEGILERRIGDGTYVANQKVQEKMSGITSFTELMAAQGKTASSKVVSYHLTQASMSEAEQLKLQEGDAVLRMERIRFGNAEPISLETATIPGTILTHLTKDEVTKSFYSALENHGFVVGHAQQTVTAQLATEKVADYLQVKRGDAILHLRQLSFLEDGTPFEYVRTQYVGARFEFYLEK